MTPFKTEKELKDAGFIHLYVVSGSLHVYGRGNDRYYCENGTVRYQTQCANDAKDFVW